MKNKLIKATLIVLFSLYLIFISIDYEIIKVSISSFKIKMFSIFLCLLITLCIGNDEINLRDKNLLQLGMLLTFIADLCLIMYNKYFLGVLIFSTVQMVYYFRFNKKNNISHSKKLVTLLILLVIFYYGLYILNIIIDPTIILGIYYSVLIGTNLVNVIRLNKKDIYPRTNFLLIYVGFLLFILCDINVGISYVFSNYSRMVNITQNLIWVFYLPSQVLLALSGFRYI